MERRAAAFVAASALFMVVLLLIDRAGLAQQLALGAATAAFVWIFVRRCDVDPRQVICCILVATTGEVILSLGWGLYTYAHAVIPLYVPPGHGLFYTLAVVTARQEVFRRRAEPIVRGVIVAGSVIAVVSLAVKHDVWGFLWWLGALALIRASRNRLLLSACFVYTMMLEWAGTAIGNWRWAAEVPGLGLHSANPPAGVGILYVLLDIIVVAICAPKRGQASACPPGVSEVERDAQGAAERGERVLAEGGVDPADGATLIELRVAQARAPLDADPRSDVVLHTAGRRGERIAEAVAVADVGPALAGADLRERAQLGRPEVAPSGQSDRPAIAVH
jgi:hypothetical protein